MRWILLQRLSISGKKIFEIATLKFFSNVVSDTDDLTICLFLISKSDEKAVSHK